MSDKKQIKGGRYPRPTIPVGGIPYQQYSQCRNCKVTWYQPAIHYGAIKNSATMYDFCSECTPEKFK